LSLEGYRGFFEGPGVWEKRLARRPAGTPAVPGEALAKDLPLELVGLDRHAQKHKNEGMRTTIDLPDELFRQAKARAALDGMRLKDLITRFVEQGLRGAVSPGAPARRRRSELPVARAATGRTLPDLTNAEIHRILDEEEAAGGRPD
jgi:Arc/MetJ family transcription regulator